MASAALFPGSTLRTTLITAPQLSAPISGDMVRGIRLNTMPLVAEERIWAPWRLEYVKGAKDAEGCILCNKAAEGDDEAALIVHRGDRCFVILNLYPYTNGHLMVAPYEHLGSLAEIPAETTAEMMALTQRAIRVLEDAY